MTKKQKSNTPGRKRMNRDSRLQAAKHWMPKYDGKNIIRGYMKHFGVDFSTVAVELEMLGVKIDSKYVGKLKRDQEKQEESKERKRRKKQEEECDEFPESDEYFYFIAGYTSNGVPFGISWEEHYESEYYYIAGYKDGKPYGITWEEFEISMPTDNFGVE